MQRNSVSTTTTTTKKEMRLASSQLASDLTSILDKQEEEKEVLKTIEDSLHV